MATQVIPDSSVPVVRSDGTMDENWYRIFRLLSSQVNASSASIADTSNGLGTKAAKSQAECWSGFIEYPDDKDYKIVTGSPFAWTITKVRTITAAGTCTVTVKINSTALGGTANGASTSEQEQDHSSDNAVAEGDDITVVISSSSAVEGLTVTIEGERTLD